MAETRQSKSRSIGKSSDVLQDIYCNPCFEVDEDVLEAVGFCQDCVDFLCSICVAAHRKGKQTRYHQVLDKSKMPRVKPKNKPQSSNVQSCFQHQNEQIHSFCKSCDQLCCKICLTVDHHGCKIEMLSKMAFNVKRSQELKDLKHKLDLLKKGYNDNLSKAEKHVGNIEKYFMDAIRDMKKIQTKVARLLAETEKQAEKVRAEDIQRMEAFLSICEVLGEQIEIIKANLDKKKDCESNEYVFISMKRAKRQVISFEDRLDKLNTDSTVCQYRFEPDNKLQVLLCGIEVLGKLSFSNTSTTLGPMLDKPLRVADIDIPTDNIRCSVLLPNQQLMITDYWGSIKLLCMTTNKVVDEFHLSGHPWDIAKVKNEEFAITCLKAKKIQILKVTPTSISKKREMSVSGECYGIAFNEREQTLIVTMSNPGKVEILSLTVSVTRSIENDKKGARLFISPYYVALSRDNTTMYISDASQYSVILMTLNGKVKTVYNLGKDDEISSPYGICVNKSGIVYEVDNGSYTVHQIVPGSDKSEQLLSQKDGIDRPIAITYCDVENKIYVGLCSSNTIKVFKMK